MNSISSCSSVHIPISSLHSAQYHGRKALVSAPSQFSYPTSLSNLKQKHAISRIQIKPLVSRSRRSLPVVRASQSNFLRVFQTIINVAKDGIEAGTNLVPNSVPRPLARISVTLATMSLALFVLKSFLSTAFFVLCTMGLVYFIFIAVNKGDPPGGVGGGSKDYTSTEDSLEEARRIMEKYK
uniref:Transmembrane protein n=1 Tax=Kalanchoe fedtschenkoi TaxID=63787 RepID=A0A7N0TQ21_KALFE